MKLSNRRPVINKSLGNTYLFWFVWLISLIATVYPFNNVNKTYHAYDEWVDAKILFHGEKYAAASELYQKILPYLKDQHKLYFEYGQCLNKLKKYKNSNKILFEGIRYNCDPMFYNIVGKNYQALKEYSLAEMYFKKAMFIVPNRVYPHYLLAKLYQETGNTTNLKIFARSIIKMQPKVASVATEQMKSEMSQILLNY